ncbi:MAG: hypothetical protein ABA06_04360 [Parcubacteria bacterium C7867-001]|nr:MAG: hypothetical protein ABA06_04360 [Parcubacteria bacterium C7867-001]
MTSSRTRDVLRKTSRVRDVNDDTDENVPFVPRGAVVERLTIWGAENAPTFLMTIPEGALLRETDHAGVYLEWSTAGVQFFLRADNPEAFAGKRVRVRGEINEKRYENGDISLYLDFFDPVDFVNDGTTQPTHDVVVHNRADQMRRAPPVFSVPIPGMPGAIAVYDHVVSAYKQKSGAA